MKNKILGANDYKEELANIIDAKGFNEDVENLLFSMLYKTEDSYNNYEKVKREVPNKLEFMQDIVKSIRENCNEIIIANPNSELAKELNATKCKIQSEDNKYIHGQKVICFPNEKTLLYGISKAGINNIYKSMPLESKAILTAIAIGKCISTAEVLRDFNGWSWSIVEKEIENNQCNIIYVFLTYLLGYNFVNYVQDIDLLKMNLPEEFWTELKKCCVNFYLSYDKEENEIVLKELAQNKMQLQKMQNQDIFQNEVTKKKKESLTYIKHIDELLNDPIALRNEYMTVNKKLPNEKKIFSVSTYEEILERHRGTLIKDLEDCNRMQNPTEFMKIKEELQMKIKFYEEKTDITKLEKEFIKCFMKKIEKAEEKKEIIDLIYETRYLNLLPNCKIKLNAIEQKLIPKAIKLRVLNPVSNNDELDYRILKGIFETQVISIESLYIKLSTAPNGINVELFDGDVHDRSYIAVTPEGSDIQIRKSRKTKIFE